MPIKMVRVGEIYGADNAKNYLKVLLVGPPGSGKTRLASTFPNPVYLDAEGRLLSIRDRPDIPVFKIKSISDVDEVYAMLHQEPRVRRSLLDGYDVQTVVIDTVDEVMKLLQKERLNTERIESFRLQDWGWYADRGRSMLRGFRNLDLNVILNMHVKEFSDQETGRSEKKPDIPGQLGNEIPAYVDEVFLLRQEDRLDPATGDRRHVRFLQTVGDRQFDWLKDHSGSMPAEFPVNLKDDYQRIARIIFPQATKPAQKAEPKSEPEVKEPARNGNGKAVPESPPLRKAARGKAATKAPVVDVPLPEGDPAPTSLEITEPKVEAPQATAVIATSEPAPTPEPEPEPTPEPVPEVGTESPAPEPKGPICADCGETVENPDIAELSEIRFGVPLCPKDFKARRDAK